MTAGSRCRRASTSSRCVSATSSPSSGASSSPSGRTRSFASPGSARGASALPSPEPLCYRRRMADLVAVSDDSFEGEVLQSPTPVLIDFWAPWCAPCRAIAPVVEELARDYAGKLKVVKMNVDDNPRTPSRYGVRGIPNLILFQGGQVREQIVGAVPKSQLVKAISTVVA